MKQLMNLAEQLDKHVSNFPYQINVLSETHTFNNMHTGILARFLQYPPLLESFLSSLPDWDNFGIDARQIRCCDCKQCIWLRTRI